MACKATPSERPQNATLCKDSKLRNAIEAVEMTRHKPPTKALRDIFSTHLPKASHTHDENNEEVDASVPALDDIKTEDVCTHLKTIDRVPTSEQNRFLSSRRR